MHYLHTFLTEDTVKVEVLDIERPAHFSRPVVPDPRAAGAIAAVGDVYLMPVTPGTALRHFGSLEVHAAGTQVGLDEGCERTVLDKCRQHLDAHAEVRGYARNIGLGAGRVQMQNVAALHRLAVFGSYAESHAGRDKKGVLAALPEFHFHLKNAESVIERQR